MFVRNQLIEVIAGDAARDVRITIADQAGVAIAQGTQLRKDLALAPAIANGAIHVVDMHPSSLHAQAVVGKDVEFVGVVHSFASHLRVHATGVIAEHAPKGAMGVGGGIGTERQLPLTRGVAQIVADGAGLHAAQLAVPINGDDFVEVLRPVNNNSGVAALAGEAGTASTREHWRAELAANRDSLNNVINAARDHSADRDLAIIRAIDGVDG